METIKIKPHWLSGFWLQILAWLGGVAFVGSPWLFPQVPGWWLLGSIGWALFWWYLGKVHHSYTWELRENDILFTWGWLNHGEVSIPYRAIRLVTLDQSLLGRIFNYGSVGVDSAGSAAMDVSLEGVPSPKRWKLEIEGRLR